jgi:hypothetical protein
MGRPVRMKLSPSLEIFVFVIFVALRRSPTPVRRSCSAVEKNEGKPSLQSRTLNSCSRSRDLRGDANPLNVWRCTTVTRLS